ncbi:MAG: glycosyltransferase family 4 protein [Patescibacteria group bacterium]|nr:glycosyltransferase family 4 protein [Patescibacteria group bacterium]
MRILFISHSYPPTLGGVETQNYNLSKGLSKIAKVNTIANTKGKKWLGVFLFFATFKAFTSMKKFDACLLGSGVVAPVGWFLKIFHRKKKFFCIVHGLDVTYANRKGILPFVYKNVNIRGLKKMSHLFMVGNATIEEAVKIGINREKCTFIPNGVNPDELIEKHSRQELSQLCGKNVKEKIVILRHGRFVSHKGTSWFISEVMPLLGENVFLIASGNRVGSKTAGDKDDFLQCEQAIVDKHLEKRVCLLPCLPWKDVLTLFNTVDIVVSPNVKIPGTMEGFGINVIEAGACGRVILASNLEGLADAVKDGQNGFLVESENVSQWVEKINAVIVAKDDLKRMFSIRISNYVQENFSWNRICVRYLDEMKKY